MTYTWEDVKRLANEYNSMICLSIGGNARKLLKPDHVFDEEKSVKWNREEVERHNKSVNESKENMIKARAKKWQETKDAAVCAIVSDFKYSHTNISKTGADQLFDRLYSDFDGDVNCVEDMISIFTSALSEYDI